MSYSSLKSGILSVPYISSYLQESNSIFSLLKLPDTFYFPFLSIKLPSWCLYQSTSPSLFPLSEYIDYQLPLNASLCFRLSPFPLIERKLSVRAAGTMFTISLCQHQRRTVFQRCINLSYAVYITCWSHNRVDFLYIWRC